MNGYGSSHDTVCCCVTHRQFVRLVLVGFDVVEDEHVDNNSPSLAVVDNFDFGLNANERLSVIPSDLLDFHAQPLHPPRSPRMMLQGLIQGQAANVFERLICAVSKGYFLNAAFLPLRYFDAWCPEIW